MTLFPLYFLEQSIFLYGTQNDACILVLVNLLRKLTNTSLSFKRKEEKLNRLSFHPWRKDINTLCHSINQFFREKKANIFIYKAYKHLR